MIEPHERRANELAALLQDHKARVAVLPPHIHAHSLMSAPFIHHATQNNLARAQGLIASCKAYAAAVEEAVRRHAAEEDEERGAAVNQEVIGNEE